MVDRSAGFVEDLFDAVHSDHCAERGETITMPTLDISKLDGSPEERAQVARDLHRIPREHGFFYLAGHCVDPVLVAETLAASKRFLALSEADKLAIEELATDGFMRADVHAAIPLCRNGALFDPLLLGGQP
jgi:hypothetical protein